MTAKAGPTFGTVFRITRMVVVATVAAGLMALLLTQATSLICLKWAEGDTPQCWRPQNLQIIALLWILGCIIGLWSTIGTLYETIVERQQTRSDPILTNIANANIRREAFRTCELIALTAVGAVAVTGVTATVQSRLGVLFVVIMLVWNAYLDRRERADTDELIRESKERHARR